MEQERCRPFLPFGRSVCRRVHLVNVLYPAYLMTKHKSWGVLGRNMKEVGLAAIIGVNFSIGVAMMGQGMLLLGALVLRSVLAFSNRRRCWATKASVSSAGNGVESSGAPRYQMVAAIVLLILAATIMAYGNTLAAN